MHTALLEIRNFRQAGPTVATSGQPQEYHFPLMSADGYKAVINLALHNDPRYSLSDEPGTVAAAGMKYMHIAVQFGSPTASDFAAFAAAMDHLQGEKVWVHCAANMRVTAFLGLYRVIRQSWNEDAAFEVMHSVWQPDDVWSEFIRAQMGRSHAG